VQSKQSLEYGRGGGRDRFVALFHCKTLDRNASAFSSEVNAGSREGNASKPEAGVFVLI
jgi:hypothetical protein